MAKFTITFKQVEYFTIEAEGENPEQALEAAQEGDFFWEDVRETGQIEVELVEAEETK